MKPKYMWKWQTPNNKVVRRYNHDSVKIPQRAYAPNPWTYNPYQRYVPMPQYMSPLSPSPLPYIQNQQYR